MKKISVLLMAVCLSVSFIPNQSFAAAAPVTATTDPKPPLSAEANAMISRLNEIKAMDKSELSSSEKKSLRKEVRSLRHDLRKAGGGVYLTVGAIIIIILLLILLV